jgi:hypothetical protein
MPQLMALPFVISICDLMVLETVRRNTPSFQVFYMTFLDTNKDHGDHIIVSHIFLVFGCAAPLWFSLIVDTATNTATSTNPNPMPVMAEFGVMCSGIADAMGVVGNYIANTNGMDPTQPSNGRVIIGHVDKYDFCRRHILLSFHTKVDGVGGCHNMHYVFGNLYHSSGQSCTSIG